MNSSVNQTVELEKANTVIAELKDRLKLFETQMLAPPVPRLRGISSVVEEETKEGGLPAPSDAVMGDQNETSYISKSTALQQTQEISTQAMRDQIKFMSDKITRAMTELETKEHMVQQIDLEKREAYRKYEVLEVQNFELQEKLTLSQIETETVKKEAQEAIHNTLNLSQQMAPDMTRQLLESDGIKLLDNCEILTGGDLRQSIGAHEENQMHLKEQLNLLKELEKVKGERDDFRKSKEQLQRDILNQTFGKLDYFQIMLIRSEMYS